MYKSEVILEVRHGENTREVLRERMSPSEFHAFADFRLPLVALRENPDELVLRVMRATREP